MAEPTLLWAVRHGKTPIIGNMLKDGADPNQFDDEGRTALMLASQNQRSDIVEMLLLHKADVNHQDSLGQTAILYTTEGSDIEQLLLQAGAANRFTIGKEVEQIKRRQEERKRQLEEEKQNQERVRRAVILRNIAEAKRQERIHEEAEAQRSLELKEKLQQVQLQQTQAVKERQQQIQSICISQSIRELVHFTRLKNLPSILEKGILPRSVLESRLTPTGSPEIQPFNDDHRWDGFRNAVCLSISFPNYRMFNACRKDHRFKDERWVVLSIKADTLWELDCAFSVENAAKKSVTSIPIELRKHPDMLKRLFDDYREGDKVIERSKLNLPINYTTNPQAEVLVFGHISPDRIDSVYFMNYDDLRLWQAQATFKTHANFLVKGKYFTYRPDYETWRTAPGPSNTSFVADEDDIPF